MRELASGHGRSLLFTRTKHGARKLARQLTLAGVPAVELHGNLAPNAIPVAPSTSPWVPTGHDFSFLIAGRCAPIAAGSATGTCAADFNQDGAATVKDLFDFLAAYFAGCH